MNTTSPVIITSTDDVPNGTYFRTGDTEPIINNEERMIVVQNGEGSRRSWGRPGVTSTIVLRTPDLVAIHVGFHHKHGGGQFWRYYRINGVIQQVTWSDIDDDVRSAILDAAATDAPRWAKAPGKLRANYKSSNPKASAFTAYKICGIDDDGNLTSLYNPSIVYELGKTKVEAARGGYDEWNGYRHDGGWYVHLDPVEVVERYIAGELVGEELTQPRTALVECECWGNAIQYPNGKIAVTYCKPLQVLRHIEIETEMA